MIKLTKAKASWIENAIVDTLCDINLEIKQGTLVAIVGSVGSGKSSLLQVLLKELPLNTGKLQVSTKYEKYLGKIHFLSSFSVSFSD